MNPLDELAERRLVVVSGKGGVGKTTLAALLGRALEARGRRVLLLEVDPRESLHQVLGIDPSGGEIVPAGGQLWAQNLQARTVIDRLVEERVPLSFLARKITDSAAFQHFVGGAPGLKEMALLGYAYRMLHAKRRPKPDLVIVDAPATGHGIALLAAPGLLAGAVEGGQLGEMAAEVAAFVADPRACGVVLATLAEEMPVQETLELVALLEARMGRSPDLVVANALYPPYPSPAPKGPEAALALWRERRRLNERELGRLREAWKGPLAQLPLLPLDRGPALLEALRERLEGEPAEAGRVR